MPDLSDEAQGLGKNRVTLNGHPLSLVERVVLEVGMQTFLKGLREDGQKLHPGYQQACINILEKMKS